MRSAPVRDETRLWCVSFRIRVMAAAPSASQREDCYAARDSFYACMVKSGERVEACKREEKEFHGRCLPSWVSDLFEEVAK